MLSLLFLIPIALGLTGLIIWAFLWAVRSGQYDDLERSGKELLYEESESGVYSGVQSGNQASDGPAKGADSTSGEIR